MCVCVSLHVCACFIPAHNSGVWVGSDNKHRRPSQERSKAGTVARNASKDKATPELAGSMEHSRQQGRHPYIVAVQGHHARRVGSVVGGDGLLQEDRGGPGGGCPWGHAKCAMRGPGSGV